MDTKVFQQIKQDAQTLAKAINPLGIVIFGSFAKNTATENSDIDICIVKPNCSIQKALSQSWQLFGDRYDYKIFEELPIYMQAEILDYHIVVYAPSEPELYEYWYHYRKAIATYRYRLKVAYAE